MVSQITSAQTVSSSIAISFMPKFRSISTTIIHYHLQMCGCKTWCFSISSCKLQWMLLCRGPYQIVHGYIQILKWNIIQLTLPLHNQHLPRLTSFICSCMYRSEFLDSIHSACLEVLKTGSNHAFTLSSVTNTIQGAPMVSANVDKNMLGNMFSDIPSQ